MALMRARYVEQDGYPAWPKAITYAGWLLPGSEWCYKAPINRMRSQVGGPIYDGLQQFGVAVSLTRTLLRHELIVSPDDLHVLGPRTVHWSLNVTAAHCVRLVENATRDVWMLSYGIDRERIVHEALAPLRRRGLFFQVNAEMRGFRASSR